MQESSHELLRGMAHFARRTDGRSRSTFVTVLESCAICKFETGPEQIRDGKCTHSPISLSLPQTRPNTSGALLAQKSTDRESDRQTDCSDRLERPCVHRDARQVTAEEQAIKLMMVCPSQSALCRLCGLAGTCLARSGAATASFSEIFLVKERETLLTPLPRNSKSYCGQKRPAQ